MSAVVPEGERPKVTVALPSPAPLLTVKKPPPTVTPKAVAASLSSPIDSGSPDVSSPRVHPHIESSAATDTHRARLAIVTGFMDSPFVSRCAAALEWRIHTTAFSPSNVHDDSGQTRCSFSTTAASTHPHREDRATAGSRHHHRCSREREHGAGDTYRRGRDRVAGVVDHVVDRAGAELD